MAESSVPGVPAAGRADAARSLASLASPLRAGHFTSVSGAGALGFKSDARRMSELAGEVKRFLPKRLRRRRRRGGLTRHAERRPAHSPTRQVANGHIGPVRGSVVVVDTGIEPVTPRV